MYTDDGFFNAAPEVRRAVEAASVALRADGATVETWMPPSAAALEFLDRYAAHPEPEERIEAPLVAQQSIGTVAGSVGRGFTVVIDYGYTRDELLAGRHRGTVMAYRQHSASSNPTRSR